MLDFLYFVVIQISANNGAVIKIAFYETKNKNEQDEVSRYLKIRD